jgi:endo-1,4-beta-xylanase
MTNYLLLTAVAACTLAAQTASEPALKDVFEGAFRIGAALNPGQFTEKNTAGAALVKHHFNTITPENVLKWERVHPELERYDFEPVDAFVAFGEKNRMFIVGHTLVWHSQTPKWVFQDSEGKPLTREALLERMRQHIHAVVGRYQGRIDGWDVVNEALNEDGTLRQSRWLQIIGEDYLVKAFQFAHEADPDAELYYNDYSLENAPKRAGAVALIRKLQEAGARVTAIGTQSHNQLAWPTLAQQDSTLQAFADLGIKVAITELDVDVLPRREGRAADLSPAARDSLNPYREGLPDSVQAALAQRYADLFGVYLKYQDAITRVTFWGVTDRQSWLNGFPLPGRTNHPLLFDRAGRPKPALEAVLRAARKEGNRP